MIKNKIEKTLTREEKEESFRQAEASVLLEGYDISKDAFAQDIKARVLSGELSTAAAINEIKKHHSKG